MDLASLHTLKVSCGYNEPSFCFCHLYFDVVLNSYCSCNLVLVLMQVALQTHEKNRFSDMSFIRGMCLPAKQFYPQRREKEMVVISFLWVDVTRLRGSILLRHGGFLSCQSHFYQIIIRDFIE